MKKILLLAIRFYQKYLSLDKGLVRSLFFIGGVCRFTPTCSEYAYQAIEKHGIIRGLSLTVNRIFRCHPFSKGGLDKVPSS